MGELTGWRDVFSSGLSGQLEIEFFAWNMSEKGTKKPEAYFIILSIKNIIWECLWTRKEQNIFCWNLGMIEKEQKGLKLVSLSLVLGTLLDGKEHLWTKREQLFVRNC